MATATVDPTTSRRQAVERHAGRVKDVLRMGRSRARKQDDDYARAVAKSVLSSDRCKAVELVTTLVVDLAHRGPLEDAEAIGLTFCAIARAEHAAARPAGSAELSVDEAHMAEELAEGDVEVAETAMARDPSVTNCLKYLSAAAVHERARRELNAAVRRDLAKPPK